MYIRSGLGTFRNIRQRLSGFKLEVRDPTPLLPGLPTWPSEAVAAAIARIGRCEDVRISPDGTRIAIPGFETLRCLILEIAFDEQRQAVTIDDFLEVESAEITQPHGVEFLDANTLAVANRNGGVNVYRLPTDFGGKRVTLAPISTVTGRGFSGVHCPGSLVVSRSLGGEVSLLICNNYIDRVSQHFLDPDNDYRETHSRVAMARGLYIPDGIALTADGGWIAVNCHGSHRTQLFASHATGRFARPRATLTGAHYPHGLRFTPDGRWLLVADGGSPYIHVYRRGESWEGRQAPERSVRVLDDETYAGGAELEWEGGPKGVDIDPLGRFVAMSCELQPLKFVSLAALTGDPGPEATADERAAARPAVL